MNRGKKGKEVEGKNKRKKYRKKHTKKPKEKSTE